MDSSTYRRPGAFSPRPSVSYSPKQIPEQRPGSSGSDSSSSSQLTALSTNQSGLYQQQQSQGSRQVISSASSNASSTSLNFSRPSISHVNSDIPLRKNSPFNPAGEFQRHKRQHSQGFFEPSLPTASLAEHSHSTMSNLTASQIAAQAAMQQQSLHMRKRSQTVPSPQSPPENNNDRRMRPPPLQAPRPPSRKASGSSDDVRQYRNGSVGGPNATAAAVAAAAAYPSRLSPGLTNFEQLPPEKEQKYKSEKPKMKLFSKPKHIGIPGYKDSDQKRPLPSPSKATSPGPSSLYKAMNASATSLADPASSASSFYSIPNASTSTLVPHDRQRNEEKEKSHKNFLSRQKNKFKDKLEDHSMVLSSASSNSKPVDPDAPRPLYSFAPQPASPGPSITSFSKSVSGLDLRHGGRALREKKKEEKAMAMPPLEPRRSDTTPSDWVPTTAFISTGTHPFGPSAASSVSIFGGSAALVGEFPTTNLQGFGLPNMTAEDAWDYLKAKLLIVFEGEELRIPIEDLNRLITAHVQRCIKLRAPTIIIEDLHGLLQTGFLSLDQTLRGIPDDRLVPYLVELWMVTFGRILPYMQAVFLPLDLEFKGHGPLMTAREAAEFWGVQPEDEDNNHNTDLFSSPSNNELDVRRIALISYRDNVILPRYDNLKAIFSRLSLDSINPITTDINLFENQSPGFPRPGTPGSLDPGLASFNSQSSTLLDTSSTTSSAVRSRAVSNISNTSPTGPELPSFAPQFHRPNPHHQQGHGHGQQQSQNPSAAAAANSAQVTETVARMLQCLSVLASVQSGDDSQRKMEALAKELKLNWLGRGRTGRNRRGFVGTRVRARGVREEVGLGEGVVA
ncbi:MAG: hypothetical protein MMC33_000222 [Icmadophila ericetorum]|nr:hypothetical protein [Icmadophila ericetorum]